MELQDKSFVSLLVLFNFINSVLNFNFDTNFTIVYEHPGEESELFGYSVILYEGDNTTNPWVQVGSPKATTLVKSPVQKNLETGTLYRCGIKEKCSTLLMPIEATVAGATLGNSMDLSPDGKLFAACGHRWIESTTTDYYAQGFCHWGNTNDNKTEQKVLFKDKPRIISRGKSTIYNFGQGQAGFAVQFADNPKTQELIVGAPGVYNWAGLTFLWKGDEYSGPGAARRKRRMTGRAPASLSELKIPAGDAAVNIGINDLSLFGYSVTSGNFYGDSTIYIAAGAPKANMIGETVIFTIPGESILKKQVLKGLEYGEYYGGSAASANLNGDNFVDLIIGAPTYRANKYNEGKIYVYYGSRNGLKDSVGEIVSIEGKQPGGQFGDSITSLGDIDFDGYEDIAVAATYEDDGAGVVYIYRGSQDGIITVPAQVIKGKDYVGNIKGFGHGIARPRDIDTNRYNDLAIGAYKSGQVLIFRARPVIILHHMLEEDKIIIKVGDKGFQFKSCVHYTTNKQLDNVAITLIPEYVIDERNRRALLVETPKKITLTAPGVKACDTYNVQLKDRIDNRYEAIKYILNLNLEERPVAPNFIRVERGLVTGNDNFCPTCPVLDPKEPKEWEGRLAGFHLGCGDDDICNASLHIKTSFKGINNDIFVIGSQQFLKLVTEVTNTGERAYLTEVSIALPSHPKVSLRSVPPYCREHNVTFVICSVADPLDENGKKSIELELDMDKINSGTNSEVAFNVTVLTSSVNNEPSSMVLRLYATKEANIQITGRSKENYYQFDNTSSVVEFAQVLQIQKQGPSTIDDVKIELTLPTAIRNLAFLEMYQPTLVPKGQSINCRGVDFIEKPKESNADAVDNLDAEVDKTRRKRSAEDVTGKFQHFTGFYVNCSNKFSEELMCTSLECYTGVVNKETVEIQFKFRMNISNIPPDVLGESDVLVMTSEFKANIIDSGLAGSPTRELLLPSVLVGPNVQKMVPIWIIIVAVLCGILVLAIIAAVLYKCGFFKRAQKEKLMEEMKAENDATEAINLTENDDDEQ